MNSLSVIPERKIGISFDVIAQINQPLTITIKDKENEIKICGNIVQKSINSPVSADRIKEQLEKLGNTPFKLEYFNIINDEEIFISIKELNELRRNLVEQLIEKRSNKKTEFYKREVSFENVQNTDYLGVTAQVFNEEQLKACLKLELTRIYIENEELYNKYSEHKNVYYKLPRCTRNPSSLQKERTLISDYFEFDSNNQYVADYPMNITNIYTLYYLEKLNILVNTLSVELTEYELNSIISEYKEKFNKLPSVEILIYGRVENMLIKGNILSLNKNEYNTNLIDFKERKFPVYFDGENTHILNYENKKIDPNVLSEKISMRFNFFDETAQEITNIVNQYI